MCSKTPRLFNKAFPSLHTRAPLLTLQRVDDRGHAHLSRALHRLANRCEKLIERRDQIIVSEGLKDKKGLGFDSKSVMILDLPKYRQQEGDYAHYPFRFWAGNSLLGGYSDHLAVRVTIIKI